MKRLFAVVCAVVLTAAALAGCSGNKDKSFHAAKVSDETLIIGYTENAAPFLEVDKDGKGTGFMADLWAAVFDSVKGDFKSYRFEKVEKGYRLEDDGGFFDENKKEYSAGLLMGAVCKNDGTFNEDYSFTEPIITNRVIAVTKKDGKVKDYASFKGARVITVNDTAKAAFEKNSVISGACQKAEEKGIDEALKLLESGKTDAVITDEFSFNKLKNKDSFTVLDGELDTVEYVIACAKYSGWKDSINEAIRELKDDQYGDGDEFTPLVEKYFGYNASSFNYISEGNK